MGRVLVVDEQRNPVTLEPAVALVEDDGDLRRMLSRGLTEEGFAVSSYSTGAALLSALERQAADLLVIDIGLPDSDGRDVCQALRARGVDVPVMFLTARGALSDRLSGFHVGGDDYLVKPFALDELMVRLRALLRRPAQSGVRIAGELMLDPATHSLRDGEREQPLTPTEFRILALLSARHGEVVRRRELITVAWPAGAVVHDNTLDAYLARLRRKLRTLDRPDAIVTVHGVGYRLNT
ncbi:MAG TPA: response regulator transcription factor [Solirubrobacteraceae bacterium]|jgi:two-component system response regulator MprA